MSEENQDEKQATAGRVDTVVRRCAWKYFDGGECGSEDVTDWLPHHNRAFCARHAKDVRSMGFILRKIESA